METRSSPSLRGHLFCQPGLTDARLASDRSQPTAVGNGAVDKPTQKAPFRLSAYKGGALSCLVLHGLTIIPPAVTDRARGHEETIVTTEPAQSHVAVQDAKSRVRRACGCAEHRVRRGTGRPTSRLHIRADRRLRARRRFAI